LYTNQTPFEINYLAIQRFKLTAFGLELNVLPPVHMASCNTNTFKFALEIYGSFLRLLNLET